MRRSAPRPDDAAPLYTVSQVAALLDVQPACVRCLDSEGVVVPERTSGGQRRHLRHDVDHIAALLELLAEGLILAAAQRIADLRRQLERRPKSSPSALSQEWATMNQSTRRAVDVEAATDQLVDEIRRRAERPIGAAGLSMLHRLDLQRRGLPRQRSLVVDSSPDGGAAREGPW